MTTTEERLRAALRARAELVPLAAPSLPTRARARGHRLFVATAAAVIVAAIVATSVFVSSWHSIRQTAGGKASVQQMIPSPLPPRELASAAWTGSKLLIWGGTTTEGSVAGTGRDDAALYDPVANSWEPAQTDPTPTAPSTATVSATVGSVLYTFGAHSVPSRGNVGQAPVASRYDSTTNTWSALPAPPLCATAASSAGTQIQLAGFTCDGRSAMVFGTYDTVSDTWTEGPALPTRSTPRELLHWHGGIIAVSFYAEFMFLAADAKSWTGLPPVPGANIIGDVDPGFAPPKVAVAILGGQLVAVAAVPTSGTGPLTHVYVWNDRTNAWGPPITVAHDGPSDRRWAVTTDGIAWITDGGLVWMDGGLTPQYVSAPSVSTTDGGAPTMAFLGPHTVAYWGFRVGGNVTNTGLLFHLP